MTKLKLSDVDLKDATALVLGKGRRPRVVPFGKKTSHALDRYLRVRSLHSTQVAQHSGWDEQEG